MCCDVELTYNRNTECDHFTVKIGVAKWTQWFHRRQPVSYIKCEASELIYKPKKVVHRTFIPGNNIASYFYCRHNIPSLPRWVRCLTASSLGK
jgi:hypothetical protein